MRNVSLLAAVVAISVSGAGIAEAGPFGNKLDKKIGWTSQQRVIKSTQLLKKQIDVLSNHLSYGPAFNRATKLGQRVVALRKAIKNGQPAFAIKNRHQQILNTYRNFLAAPKKNLKKPGKQAVSKTRRLVTRLNYNMRARQLDKLAENMGWRADKFAHSVGQQESTSFLKQDAKILGLNVNSFADDAASKIGFGIAFNGFKSLQDVYCGTEEQAHYALAGSYNWSAKHSARKLQDSYKLLHRALLGFSPAKVTGPLAGCGTHSFY